MADLSVGIHLRLLRSDQGGRESSIFDDYRPSWDLGNRWHGQPTRNDGRVFLDGIRELAPGADGAATIVPVVEEFWAALEVGAVLPMSEGARVVGYATVTEMRRAEHFTREAAAFVLQARQYVELLEQAADLPLRQRLHSARERLLQLYAAGCALPSAVSDDDLEPGPDARRPERWPGFERFERYSFVFDPYGDDSPVAGELSDDLLDINLEVRRGLELWTSRKTRAAALWEWRFGIDTHWGAHAVQALSALHHACAMLCPWAGRRPPGAAGSDAGDRRWR